jgi:hypothetical protein
MKTRIIYTSLLVLLLCTVSYADETPKIVNDGMEAFKTAGFGGAFDVWLKGSPLESDKTTTMNLKGSFIQIETMYGRMTGYEILKTVKVSSSTIRVYAEVRYEKGPLFMFLDCYKSAGGWIIPTMRFQTDADKILPEDIFTKR